jgi:ribose/xylose/arabinose/galactoside ABC-type transport system permease subunit
MTLPTLVVAILAVAGCLGNFLLRDAKAGVVHTQFGKIHRTANPLGFRVWTAVYFAFLVAAVSAAVTALVFLPG